MTNPLTTSWINAIVGLLGFLIVLPVASAYLSNPQFTLWLFGNSIIAVGILFETSVSVVFTRMLTAYMSHGSLARSDDLQNANDRIAGFICTSFLLYVAVGLIGAAGSYLAGRYSIGGLIAIGLDPSEAHRTLLALGGIAASSILLTFCRSVLIANRQMRVQRTIMLPTTIGKLALNAAIFAFFARVDIAMAAIVVVNMLETILVAALARKVLWPALQVRPSLRDMDEFVGPFGKTFLIRIGAYLTMYSSSIIVVRYTPAEADAYLLSFRLVQAASSVALIPVSISLPALTRMRTLIMSNELKLSVFVETSLRLIAFSLSCLILMLLGFLLFGPEMLGIVTSGKSLLSRPALVYLCIIFILESHHMAHSMVYETQNSVPFFAISIASGVAILGLSIILVPRFGAWGALVALNAVQMSANNWVPIWFNIRQWKMSLTDYFCNAARFVLRPSFAKILDPDT